MFQECLMNDCERKFSMENFRKESALKVVKRNATMTPLRISIFQVSPGNRLHMIKQRGVASSTKERRSLKQRETVKLKESAKPGSKDHHQSHYSVCVQLLLNATDSLELKLA